MNGNCKLNEIQTKNAKTKKKDSAFKRCIKFFGKLLGTLLCYALCQMCWMIKDFSLNLLAVAIAGCFLYWAVVHPLVETDKTIIYRIKACTILFLSILLASILAGLLLKNEPIAINQEILDNYAKTSPAKLVVLTSFFAPVFEETIFRRDLISFKNKKQFEITVTISMILFVLMHIATSFITISLIISYFIPTIFLTLAYTKTKDLKCSMVVHCLYNLVISIILVTTI